MTLGTVEAKRKEEVGGGGAGAGAGSHTHASLAKQIQQQIAVNLSYLWPVDSSSSSRRRDEVGHVKGLGRHGSFSQVAAWHTQLAASSRLALLIELQKLRHSVPHNRKRKRNP